MKDKEDKKKTTMEEDKSSEKKVAPKSAEEQLAEALKATAEWKNKYYMAFADTENLRKQYDKDQREFIKYRAMGFVDKLLPVLDNFHMVLGKDVEDPVLKNYLTGFQYIYRQMVEALDSEGVKEFAPHVGDPFDERKMHAVDTEERDDIPANRVVAVYTNGYLLADRLIRPAQVRVSKAKTPAETTKSSDEHIDEAEAPQEENLN